MIAIFFLIFLASFGLVGLAIVNDAIASDIQIIALTLVSGIGVMSLGFSSILYYITRNRDKGD